MLTNAEITLLNRARDAIAQQIETVKDEVNSCVYMGEPHRATIASGRVRGLREAVEIMEQVAQKILNGNRGDVNGG